MLLMVTISLSNADVAAFDQYEAQILPRLGQYGGQILHRLRAADGQSEFHLLEFASAEALAAFQADPIRASLQQYWIASGASATITAVAPYP